MAKLKFKPLSIKGTHKEKMTETEKKDFDWNKWNKDKLQKGGFTNPKANEMAKRQRFDSLTKNKQQEELVRRTGLRDPARQGELAARRENLNIRDEAQKEIDKKTKLENYFETGEYKGKERHEGKGRWVTMKGRRVFIEDGENPTDALNKSLAWEKKNKRRSSGGNKDWNK